MSELSSQAALETEDCGTGVSRDALHRVRWLSVTGVGSGLLVLIIATILLAWHHQTRKQASRVEAQINEARLAMSRATIQMNRKRSRLLSTSPAEEETTMQPTSSDQDDNWRQDLLLAGKTCDSLNRVLQLRGGQELRVTVEPLSEWIADAEDWKSRDAYLRATARQRFTEVDLALQELLKTAEELRGVNRLKLAVGLRSHFTPEPKPIDEILRDCAGTTLANQLSGDLTHLRLRLSQLMTSTDVDELADIGQNFVRPILLRLKSAGEDFELVDLISRIEAAIFGDISADGDKGVAFPGIYSLRYDLAEHRGKRERLLERAVEQASTLDHQRDQLAIAGDHFQRQLSEGFARALYTGCAIILGSASILGLIFVILTRKVSKGIAMQVHAIDRSANELANERLLLSSVISSLPIPLYWKDDHGRYQGCSREFAEWVGLSSDQDVMGRTDDELAWDDETKRQDFQLEQSIEESGYAVKNMEMSKRLEDGQISVVLASKTPLRDRDDVTVGIVGAYIDITERKASEVQMRGLATVMAECPSEIFVFDMRTYELLEINRAACQNLQVEKGYCVGRTLRDFMPESHAEDLAERLLPIVEGKTVEVEYESAHQRADGSVYPVHVRALTIQHESRRVFVACATDMTLYKKLESKLAQAQNLESIGQLAAGIAHEINTPMQCICGNIEFLQTYSGRLLSVVDEFQTQLIDGSEDWHQRIERMKAVMKENRFDFVREEVPLAIEESSKAAEKVVEIVRAMKVISHPGTKERTTTNINKLVQDAITISRNRWKYAAEVELQLDDDIPEIDALPAELSQVFLNLIVNAADAISEKRKNDADELGEIRVRTKFDDENIYIDFCDNGSGMDEDVKSRVFEPFFTTKDVGQGTGQGLSITYDVIVKLHNGSVDIQSKPGQGTTFRVSIPRRTNDSESAQNESFDFLTVNPVAIQSIVQH